jgi:hypothetical protein
MRQVRVTRMAPELSSAVPARQVTPERSSRVVEEAVVPEELASWCGRHPGSGFPLHTCIAGRLCRIASAPPSQPRRPVHSRSQYRR